MRESSRGRPVLLAVLFVLATIPAPVRASDVDAWLDTQIRLEGELLDRSIASYRTVRLDQARLEDRLRSLEDQLDEELFAESPAVAEIERLEDESRQVRALLAERSERASRLRSRVVEHLIRSEALRTLREEAPARSADPVSGRWRLRVLPQGQLGLMELELDGTLVRGTYALDGGFHGSLRGTYVRRELRLERVDAEEGFDVIYEGVLDAVAERIQGQWRATLLNRPGPSGGDWIAERVEGNEVEE